MNEIKVTELNWILSKLRKCNFNLAYKKCNVYVYVYVYAYVYIYFYEVFIKYCIQNKCFLIFYIVILKFFIFIKDRNSTIT